MIYGLWLSTAGIQTVEHRQSVLANNIANVNTTGFKQDLAVVRQRDVMSAIDQQGMRFQHPVLDNLAGGSSVRPSHTDFSSGPLTQTGGTLDLAIEGKGFFTVETESGHRYTRDGRFTIGRDGTLRTVTGGHSVLDASGNSIRLRTDQPADSIQINGQGRITQKGEVVGQLAVTDFADTTRLQKEGGNLFDNRGSEEIEPTGVMRSGVLEASNVNAADAMVTMIEASRAYQLNATMIQIQDEMLARTVNDIGRVG